ncbi:hypothetical protein MRX96_040525 [Rhipicephalus microplus]
MASRLIAGGSGCSPDIALRMYNAVASARTLCVVHLLGFKPTQWATLDVDHRGLVRCLFGLPRSSPIRPYLAEACQTLLSLRAKCAALRHLHRIHRTPEGRRFAARLLDRLHSECPVDETIEHVLLQHPGYADQRRRLFDAYGHWDGHTWVSTTYGFPRAHNVFYDADLFTRL